MFARTRRIVTALSAAAVLTVTGLIGGPAASAAPTTEAPVTGSVENLGTGPLGSSGRLPLPSDKDLDEAIDELLTRASAMGPDELRAARELIGAVQDVREGRTSFDGTERDKDKQASGARATNDEDDHTAVKPLIGIYGDKSDRGGLAPWLDDDGVNDDPAAYRNDVTEKKDFWGPALVPNCGVEGSMSTVANATVQPGPNYGAGPILGKNNLLSPYVPSGHAFFHIFTNDIRLTPVVDGTNMTVLWFNLTQARGGTDKLDDTVLGAGVNSQTSKLVKTGKGAVLAVISGTVAYPGDGATCTVLPTVGSTTVG